jgi:hypothetical protein
VEGVLGDQVMSGRFEGTEFGKGMEDGLHPGLVVMMSGVVAKDYPVIAGDHGAVATPFVRIADAFP